MEIKSEGESINLTLPCCTANAQTLTGLKREGDLLLLECMHIFFVIPIINLICVHYIKYKKGEKKRWTKKVAEVIYYFSTMKHLVYKMKF